MDSPDDPGKTPGADSGRRRQRDRRTGPRRANEGASRLGRRAQDATTKDTTSKDNAAGADGRALVPLSPAVTHDAAKGAKGSANSAAGSAAFAAQLLGQPGAKRGLKGGAPVLDGARTAYLESEYLGKGERRAPKGVITKTEI